MTLLRPKWKLCCVVGQCDRQGDQKVPSFSRSIFLPKTSSSRRPQVYERRATAGFRGHIRNCEKRCKTECMTRILKFQNGARWRFFVGQMKNNATGPRVKRVSNEFNFRAFPVSRAQLKSSKNKVFPTYFG